MKDKAVYIVSTEETYHYGQVVYEEGNSGDWVYVILSGLVEVSKNVGGKKYIIEILQAGDVFGVIEYIGRMKRTTTVRAIGLTTIGLIDREFLDREYNQLSGPLRGIFETMARRSKKILDRFSESILRAEPRSQKILPLFFSDGQTSYRAHTVDVSTSGLFIVTEHHLEPGQEILVKLSLPGVSSPLQINCKVVWTSSKGESENTAKLPGMGVKFNKISKKDFNTLRDFFSIKQADN
jgi:CRP-like cAMP-binding protein